MDASPRSVARRALKRAPDGALLIDEELAAAAKVLGRAAEGEFPPESPLWPIECHSHANRLLDLGQALRAEQASLRAKRALREERAEEQRRS